MSLHCQAWILLATIVSCLYPFYQQERGRSPNSWPSYASYVWGWEETIGSVLEHRSTLHVHTCLSVQRLYRRPVIFPKIHQPDTGGGGREKVSGVGLNDGAVRTIMSSRMKCDPSPRLTTTCRGLVRKAHERTETRGGKRTWSMRPPAHLEQHH